MKQQQQQNRSVVWNAAFSFRFFFIFYFFLCRLGKWTSTKLCPWRWIGVHTNRLKKEKNKTKQQTSYHCIPLLCSRGLIYWMVVAARGFNSNPTWVSVCLGLLFFPQSSFVSCWYVFTLFFFFCFDFWIVVLYALISWRWKPIQYIIGELSNSPPGKSLLLDPDVAGMLLVLLKMITYLNNYSHTNKRNICFMHAHAF